MQNRVVYPSKAHLKSSGSAIVCTSQKLRLTPAYASTIVRLYSWSSDPRLMTQCTLK